MPVSMTLVLVSENFSVEHSKAAVIGWDAVSAPGSDPFSQYATCVMNEISEVMIPEAGSYDVRLADMTVRHLQSGDEWPVRGIIVPLTVNIVDEDLRNGVVRVKFPYSQVFQLATFHEDTLDGSRTIAPNCEILWMCGARASPPTDSKGRVVYTSASRTDANGQMTLLENPTSWPIDMPVGSVMEIRRIL